jgi:hypothetical protein
LVKDRLQLLDEDARRTPGQDLSERARRLA